MIVTDITAELDSHTGAPAVSALLRREQSGPDVFRLRYIFHRIDDAELIMREPTGDAFVPAALLASMVYGEDLTIEAPVSDRLLQQCGTIMDIYSCWHQISPIRVDAYSKPATGSGGRSCGLFFSGGVDSMYSLIKHQQTINHLLLVHGFDGAIPHQAAFPELLVRAHQAAAERGKKLIWVETNLRNFTDSAISWIWYAGAGLASVGLLLSNVLSRCYIASSHDYKAQVPWGSHPLLDPLWSTEALEFLHDGCEAARARKVKTVAEASWPLQYLRVCYEDPSQLNCGRCEKCIRTMLELYVAGALDKSPTFPGISELALRRLILSNESVERHYVEILGLLGINPEGQRYRAAIQYALRRSARIRKYSRMYRHGHSAKAFLVDLLRALRPSQGLAGTRGQVSDPRP
jgi:hypothetical protein